MSRFSEEKELLEFIYEQLLDTILLWHIMTKRSKKDHIKQYIKLLKSIKFKDIK